MFSSQFKRFLIVFFLGFSSGIPLALVTGTLQAWYAESGMSLMATGALSLVGLPYSLRIVWGPLVDRYSLFFIGKRRSWILTMQVFLLLGFNVMAWLSPSTSGGALAIIALVLACCSATQDIAIDAHRTEYLSISEHGLGASIAVLGYRIAMLLSGGLALVLAYHFGWAFTYRLMGFFLLLGLWATIYSEEPQGVTQNEPLAHAFYAPLKEFFSRPGCTTLVLFIIFYKTGEAFTSTSSGIVMPFLIQGLGFSIETIGYLNKMLGISSVVIGGLLAGFILMHAPLYRCLLVFGVLQALTNLFFVALAVSAKSTWLLAVAVVFDNLASGMASTALVALFMRIVDRRYTATQFSLCVAISTLPRVFSGPFAAMVQESIGWVGLYNVSVILAMAFIPFWMRLGDSFFRGFKGCFKGG
jgi:PAT family beta-lactamase induction signal transducer AmpG